MIADHFTKWTAAYPLPDQGAEVVARAFVEEFVCRLGPRGVVYPDRGTNFQSQLFKRVMELLEIGRIDDRRNSMTTTRSETTAVGISTLVHDDNPEYYARSL